MKIRRKHTFILFGFCLLAFLLIVFANYTIENSVTRFISSDINSLPVCKTAVLLGTTKLLADGRPNLYFYNRLRAAYELLKTGKVRYIIVSGDNGNKKYNEPKDMRDELVRMGVPDSAIFLDYAGFRTFDSILRAQIIFGQSSFIVVSQAFHNKRAVYIARHYGIDAFGYNAEDVHAYIGIKTRVREFFARAKVFVDFLFDRKPKFLGEKIRIN